MYKLTILYHCRMLGKICVALISPISDMYSKIVVKFLNLLDKTNHLTKCWRKISLSDHKLASKTSFTKYYLRDWIGPQKSFNLNRDQQQQKIMNRRKVK